MQRTTAFALLTARRAAVKALQATGLNKIASEVYYRQFHGFRPASPGLEEGFEAIFEHAARLGSLDGRDYAEFGLFKGYSFHLAQKLADEHGLKPRFFGFDSFEGLPEITGPDQTPHDEFRKGQYACSRQEVEKNLTKAGVDWSRTFLVEGYFEDTLTDDLVRRHGIRRIGMAMVDCDLYASTVTVLDWLRPLIGDRTILVMDDWNCFGGDENRGQRRAMREFLARTPGIHLEPLVSYGLNSQAFAVRITV